MPTFQFTSRPYPLYARNTWIGNFLPNIMWYWTEAIWKLFIVMKQIQGQNTRLKYYEMWNVFKHIQYASKKLHTIADFCSPHPG